MSGLNTRSNPDGSNDEAAVGGNSSLRVLKDGYLIKQASSKMNWRERYFVLTLERDCELKYFVSKKEYEQDKKPRGSVALRGAAVIHVDSGSKKADGRKHVIEVATPARNLYMCVKWMMDLMFGGENVMHGKDRPVPRPKQAFL